MSASRLALRAKTAARSLPRATRARARARVVVVTGGTTGIGEAIARTFHARGDYVLVAARGSHPALTGLGRRARYVACDVRRPQEVRAAAEAAAAWRGGIDVFINNAGYSAWRALERVDEAFWDTMLSTNLAGVLYGCQAAAAFLRRGGCVVNVSSLAGKRGSAGNVAYCAAKFGVNGLTQALAKELGPRGIRVNAVCPVYVETALLREALSHPDSPTRGREVAAYLREFAAIQTALGRLPTAQEVAEAVYFLASPAASGISGQCVNVDCGTLPQ